MTLPKGWTSTSIVLLPKTEGACQWRDFRPISLCNVNSRIISKLMTNRISKLLPKVISACQTVFIPGRSIHNNVLLAQVLVSELDRKLRRPSVIFKIDMKRPMIESTGDSC